MKIMTFNIQHCRDYVNDVIDISLFADTIRKLGADICGLNEVRGEGPIEGYTNQTDSLGDLLQYERYFGKAVMVEETSPYGNALVSRYAFKSVETVPVPQSAPESEDEYCEPRCIIKALFEINSKELCILVTHMGLTNKERSNAVKLICDILDKTEIPVILMGDFNAEPNDEVLLPIFERMRDTDSLSANSGKATYPSDEPQIKIDYIFYRNLICNSVETVSDVVSDHLPIIAEFEF